jgi:hypothetical protein
MLYNAMISGIRTGVASLVGLLITWLISKGIVLSDAFEQEFVLALFTVVTVLYNAGVNYAATKWNPYFGYLLGIPKTPAYDKKITEAK